MTITLDRVNELTATYSRDELAGMARAYGVWTQGMSSMQLANAIAWGEQPATEPAVSEPVSPWQRVPGYEGRNLLTELAEAMAVGARDAARTYAATLGETAMAQQIANASDGDEDLDYIAAELTEYARAVLEMASAWVAYGNTITGQG